MELFIDILQMSGIKERLQKKLAEKRKTPEQRKQEEEKLKSQKEKDRCYFPYEQPGASTKKADLRGFEAGDRVCIREADNSISLGTYLDGMRTTLFKVGEGSTIGTIHMVQKDGAQQGEVTPVFPEKIGQLRPEKGGKRTRKSRNKRSKKTRRV